MPSITQENNQKMLYQYLYFADLLACAYNIEIQAQVEEGKPVEVQIVGPCDELTQKQFNRVLDEYCVRLNERYLNKK